VTTVENSPQTREIGRDRRRKEDRRLITGRTRWTDNQTLTGLLHLAIVRSPFAHAEIGSIDTSAAKQVPGVVAVYTATDIGADTVQLPCAWPITKDMKSPQRPALARNPG
jgi:carbon-monoxide dehydrogenase large subunit